MSQKKVLRGGERRKFIAPNFSCTITDINVVVLRKGDEGGGEGREGEGKETLVATIPVIFLLVLCCCSVSVLLSELSKTLTCLSSRRKELRGKKERKGKERKGKERKEKEKKRKEKKRKEKKRKETSSTDEIFSIMREKKASDGFFVFLCPKRLDL